MSLPPSPAATTASTDVTSLAMSTEATCTAALLPQSRLTVFPGTLHAVRLTARSNDDTASACERLVIAALRPGWEVLPERSGAPVHPTACLARVIDSEPLSCGGRLALILGVSRVSISDDTVPVDTEREPGDLRTVQVRPIGDVVPAVASIDRFHRRAELLDAAERVLTPRTFSLLEEAFQQERPLGTLCDLLSACLPLDVEETLALLGEANVDLRSDRLLDAVRRLIRDRAMTTRSFPPPFAFN